MKEETVRELGEITGNLLGVVFILALATSYLANVVGTIRGDINTWLGVVGIFIPPVGWISGAIYLL